MRRILLGLAALALVAALAVPALAKTRSVKLGDNWFVRPSGGATIDLRKGQKLEWEWEGSGLHNVTVSRGPVLFHSSTKRSGSFTHRFTRRGTYRIFCTVHGSAMSMKVVVR